MHGRLSVATAVAAGLGLALSVAAPADGDASGFGFTDGPSVGAGASETPAGSTPKRSGARARCDYVQLDPEESETTDRLASGGLWSSPGEGAGAWFRKICTSEDGMLSGTVVWLPARVDPRQLAQQALERVPLPQPVVRMNPPNGTGAVTNVQTWLWIEPDQWQPVSASASAGNVTVTTTADPERVVFDMGNGDRLSCGGPGTPYDPARPAAEQATDCAYTYRRSSADRPDGRYTVTATVIYRVRWSASGIAGGGALAPVSQTSSLPLRVGEIQALNR